MYILIVTFRNNHLYQIEKGSREAQSMIMGILLQKVNGPVTTSHSSTIFLFIGSSWKKLEHSSCRLLLEIYEPMEWLTTDIRLSVGLSLATALDPTQRLDKSIIRAFNHDGQRGTLRHIF
jgi:hypothetical protein